MTTSEILSKLDAKVRPLALLLPHQILIRIYSNGRKFFLNRLSSETNFEQYIPSEEHKQKLWGIEFNSPIFNAAGMFKSGDGYHAVARQGAGAYLAGTSTYLPREGNVKKGITHPFAPYPKSKMATNWMGLPNKGHLYLAEKIKNIQKIAGCPIGVSISANSEQQETDALAGIVDGLKLFESVNVDFIELNESCPNVQGHKANEIDANLINRLEYINRHYIQKRKRMMPIIVKFSNDTKLHQINDLINILTTLEFDGLNLGNTSTDYSNAQMMLHRSEKALFKYFTETFGGGISGSYLRGKSLELCAEAVKSLKNIQPKNEFHIIRTGGIETKQDIEESQKIGVELNQWFTGYFEQFSHYGHQLYKFLLEK